MHFSQILTAALALPVLSLAAAIPDKRQTVDCAQFNTLSVGAMSITGSYTNGDNVVLQYRNIGGSWNTVANTKPNQAAQAVDIFALGDGTKNVRVCNGKGCNYPAGGKDTKQWNMLRSGDRWNFSLTVIDGSDGDIQAICHVGAKIVDGASTTTPVASSTTASRTSSVTSSSTPSTTVKTTTVASSSASQVTSRASSSSSRAVTTATTTTRRHNNN